MTINKHGLLAIPDAWRSILHENLAGLDISWSEADGYDQALMLITSQDFGCVIIVSNWMIEQCNEQTVLTELGQHIHGQIPTLVLLQDIKNYDWFELLYEPSVCEYETLPCDTNTIRLLFKRMGILSST